MEPVSTATACSACGAPVTAGAAYCSQCGYALAGATPRAMPAKPKWYYNVWVTLCMLFFVLGPFGLPLVWKNPHFSRVVKMVLTLVMIAYTVLLVQLTIRAVQTSLEHMQDLQSSFQF